MTNSYTRADCGCYVDGARGIYAVDAIIAFACDHGADIRHDAQEDCDHAATCFDSDFAGCEFACDYEDEATDYMNAHYSVDSAYWGRNEYGDWGLWRED